MSVCVHAWLICVCGIYSNAQHVTGDITSCQCVKSVSNTLSQPDKRTIHTTVVISTIVHELFGVFWGHRYINHLIGLCLLNMQCMYSAMWEQLLLVSQLFVGV